MMNMINRTDLEEIVRYSCALPFVCEIADHLDRGTRHYRTRDGILLRTLDEVIRAILEDDLQDFLVIYSSVPGTTAPFFDFGTGI